MREDSKTAWKIKEQMVKFSERLCEGLKKPQKKFVQQMIYGIQASRDVKVSEVSRSLKEDIALIKTETRLSRNLQHEDMDEILEDKVLKHAASRVTKDMVLALDLSDIRKDFAKKMEYLAHVYDGSTGEKGVPGYWLLSVVGAQVHGTELVPLTHRIFSQETEDFESENDELMKAMRDVSGAVSKRGIFVIDRGGDRGKIYRFLFRERLSFVIRIDERNLLMHGTARSLAEVSRWCPCRDTVELTVNQDGSEEKKSLRVGEKIVHLPFASTVPLKLVKVVGFGKDPLFLLTDRLDKTPLEILEMYLTRWKIEESFRFLKQAYHLEDIRVRRWQSLKNMMTLVLCVFYFVSVELGQKVKLNILLGKIFQKSKRFFGIPSFKHYAVVDGIYALLFASRTGIDRETQKPLKPLPSLFPDY